MTPTTVNSNVYLKRNCPFCLKLRVFLTEARLADGFDYVVFDDGDDTHQRLRARMEAAGQTPTFPAVEFEEGKLATGTDDLIDRFAREADLAPSTMPLLAYYIDGVFSSYMDMFKQLREMSPQPK